jgi:hypothetical protein
MVELLPIRAFHPSDPAAPGLLCPVYDTLSDSELARFAKSPHNAAGFVARPTSSGLAEFLRRAPQRLQTAIQEGAYRQDPDASFYVYGIRYSPPPDILEALPPQSRRAEYLLLGLVGALDLARTPEGLIARHENVFAERVEERARLTEATGMNFAPVMAGYTLPDHGINDLLEKTLGLDRRGLSLEGTATPLVRSTLDGTEHTLWRLGDRSVESTLAQLIEPLRILILDGHHRYGAARGQLRRGGVGTRPLVMLVESRDRALQLLPWQRALSPDTVTLDALRQKAGARFASVQRVDPAQSVDDLLTELGRMALRSERGFLAVDGSAAWKFRGTANPDGGYDFDLLHGYLAEGFHKDAHDFGVFRSPRLAIEAVRSVGGPWSGGLALLLPGLHEEAIEHRAFSSGRMMAHKSTMFIPKVAEGVLFAPAR